MKKMTVGEVFKGVESKGMLEKHKAGYKVRQGIGKNGKPYFQMWCPRDGKAVELPNGQKFWKGNDWEIWCANSEWLVSNFKEGDTLVCTKIYGMRELTKKLKKSDGTEYWADGKTLQISCDLYTVEAAVEMGLVSLNQLVK